MRFAIVGARVALGLLFVVFGVNGFIPVIDPPPMEAPAKSLIGALVATGYFMPLVKGIEIVSGLMILSGRLVPLGLVLLAPVSVSIFFLHLFLNPPGLPSAAVILVVQLFLAWAYRDSFAGVFDVNSKPRATTPTA